MLVAIKLICMCITYTVFRNAVYIADDTASSDGRPMSNDLDGSACGLLRLYLVFA